MAEKIFLHLLIFCGIFYQEIIGTLSDDNIRESSDFLVRKKRVINLDASGHNPVKIEEVPYVVNIKYGSRTTCVGSILSHHTVITAAYCIEHHHSEYHVLSGSGYPHISDSRNVTRKIVKMGHPPHGIYDGISLLTVDPPFIFSRKTQSIRLYTGPVLPGTEVAVTGWGCYYPLLPSQRRQLRLRSITLPIFHHGICVNLYRDKYQITDKHLCTYDPRKLCAQSDMGAPLVINSMLAGIHIYKGEYPYQNNPDVYINLQHPEFHEWIMENSGLM